MPDQTVNISVCIVTYNSEKTLNVCLDSIFRQTVKPFEVLVCDGGSRDRTLDILQEYPVKIVATNVRAIGSARNVLVSAASGNVIAWIDSDTTIPVNWLELRGTIHEEHPEIDCLSSSLPVVTINEADDRSKIPISTELDLAPCKKIVQAGLTVKRDVIQRVGGYDPLFEWGEDWDLRIRLIRFGARLYCTKTCLSYHIRSESYVTWSKRFFLYELKPRKHILGGNFLCFLFKHGLWYVRYNPRHLATFLLRIWILYSLLGIVILPKLALTSLLLASIANLVGSKIHHNALKPGFLLQQILKALGEHRNLIRCIVFKSKRLRRRQRNND